MPVLACPSCHSRLRAPEGSTAKRVQCPKCGGVIAGTHLAAAAPAAPAAKRKGMPVWVWVAGWAAALVSFAVAFFVVARFAFGMFGGGVATATRENYDKIKHRMPRAEVEALLGKPTATVPIANEQ